MTTFSARAMLLGAAIATSMGIGYAVGAQPHMTASIALLQSARGELAAATPNKGGHRERALGLMMRSALRQSRRLRLIKSVQPARRACRAE